MKFQNPSMHGFRRTDGRTYGRTDNQKPICPVNFFEVGGIMTLICACKVSGSILGPGLIRHRSVHPFFQCVSHV